ncbi:hypothetical protein LB505_005857 [Fusarium chuoi]|nr:hypothetical protein LB505_005857 [Fusarium chuoi]
MILPAILGTDSIPRITQHVPRQLNISTGLSQPEPDHQMALRSGCTLLTMSFQDPSSRPGLVIEF